MSGLDIGQEYDSETGLYYYRSRHYSPIIGRFLQRDEWPGDITDPSSLVNKYVYCANNPVNWIDPFGWDKQKQEPPSIEEETIIPVPIWEDPIFLALTAFRFRWQPLHVGFDIPFTKWNVIHFGKHPSFGRHIGILFKGAYEAWKHIYFKTKFPFFRIWP